MVKKILELIDKIDDEKGLKVIYERAWKRRKMVADKKANKIGWYVTQKVRMKKEHQNSRPFDAIGTVEKENPKKLVVCFEGIATYNVPKSMVDPV